MVQKLRKQTKGFTIIEVLIVLAIAGLILLIVFLAVPALQRNSRNTSYRNEASQILSASTEWSNNNNGRTPSSGDNAAILDLTNTRSITTLTIETEGGTSLPNFSTAILRTGARCNRGSNPGSVGYTDSGPGRAVALLYAVENSSGGVVVQCEES